MKTGYQMVKSINSLIILIYSNSFKHEIEFIDSSHYTYLKSV